MIIIHDVLAGLSLEARHRYRNRPTPHEYVKYDLSLHHTEITSLSD